MGGRGRLPAANVSSPDAISFNRARSRRGYTTTEACNQCSLRQLDWALPAAIASRSTVGVKYGAINGTRVCCLRWRQ